MLARTGIRRFLRNGPKVYRLAPTLDDTCPLPRRQIRLLFGPAVNIP
jgi:hypothetical protein